MDHLSSTSVVWLRDRARGVARLLHLPFLPEQNFLILLSIALGALTGLCSAGFIFLLRLTTRLFFTHVASGLEVLGPARVVLLPVLGGLIVGPIIWSFAREAQGHGVPEVIKAIVTRDARIPIRVAIVKILASAVTIGSGGAAGREGPMVQIGATLGSGLGQIYRLPRSHLKTLVACGAAGGIAATFNAPIAGAIYALEVLMVGQMSPAFLLVILCSVTSSIVSRSLLGNFPAFLVPPHELVSAWEVLLYVPLGILCALAARLFVRTFYGVEGRFEGWKFPPYLKAGVGALVVGLIGRFLPHVFGTGFPAIESALWSRLTPALLLVLLLAEVCSNSFTLGSGGSGGVFAPALYIGAMLGGSFGALVHFLWPASTAGAGAYALVGMAAVFGGAAHAPLTAILILFEMTGSYRIILPLMAATVTSVSLSQRLSPDSIYTLKLRRAGLVFDNRSELAREGAPLS
jgi:CIC family chloride channel protein